jgi:hypothetical protein
VLFFRRESESLVRFCPEGTCNEDVVIQSSARFSFDTGPPCACYFDLNLKVVASQLTNDPGETPMRNLRFLPLLALASLFGFAVAAKPQAITPQVRIVNPIDENSLATLRGNTHPLANARTDRGPVDPNLPMTDLILLLSRGKEQQAAFDKFVANQYDSHSADFHHWLTPDQVGADFGPSQTDIQTITTWLTRHGFTVSEISKDHTRIRFNGTAALVESAFHTEIHNLEVHGEAHIGNMTDPKIPAALVPAVVGIKALHNFFPRPMHRAGAKVKFNTAAGKWQRQVNALGHVALAGKTAAPSLIHPEFGITVGSGSNAYTVEDVAPYDFATIYNVLPLWTAGTPIDGTGQKIAIAGTSNINPADITAFRKVFGLPAYTTNAPKVIIAHGTDPGDCPTAASDCDSDLTENTLDVEWSGAIAKGAQVILAVSGSTSSSDDTVYDSSDYVVNNITAPVLSVSYGQCELFEGSAGNASYNAMWQTAAAEGFAVFVASGDAGAALCDDGQDQQYGTPWASVYGLAVNALASSPYDTAVGGTDLNWGTVTTTNWNGTNSSTTGANAKGYIPEVPWNDTCTNPLALKTIQEDATAVKYSGSVTDAESACNFIATDSISVFENYTDSNGDPADIAYFVDTVGGSGGASTCSTNTTSISGDTENLGSCTGGYAKPGWQTTLTPADGARDLPDVSFFASNGFLGSAYLICVSANGSCVTSTTTTTEPVAQEIGGTSVSSPTMAGVMALINQKNGAPQGNPNAELYALADTEIYSACSAESVTAGSASCFFNDVDTGTISMPCDYGASNGGIIYDSNTGGETLDVSLEQAGVNAPNCTPIHSGDTVGIQDGVGAAVGYDLASGLGSLNVANVVNGWTAASTAASFSLSGTNLTIAVGASTGNTATVSITPLAGFTGAVSLTCAVTGPSGASSPATCSLPASVSVTANAAATATLTLDSTATTTPGAYTVLVTGTAGSETETVSLVGTLTGAVVTTPSWAISNAGNIAVAQGSNGTTPITVTPAGGFTGTVALTCTFVSNAGTDPATCSMNPASASVTGSSAVPTTLTVNTIAPTTTTSRNESRKLFWPSAGGATLALLLFFGLPRARRNWLAMLGLLVLFVSFGALGCGGGGGGHTTTTGGTTPGSYSVTVTGTSGTTVQSTTVTVTVTAAS